MNHVIFMLVSFSVFSLCLIKNINISPLLILSGCLNQISGISWFFRPQESTLNAKILIKDLIENAQLPLLKPIALCSRDFDTD